MNYLDLLAARPDCAAQHFGLWAIETTWFLEAVTAVKKGLLKPQARDGDGSEPSGPKLTVTPQGIALISLEGMMLKGRSSFGGASTLDTRRLLRQAASRDDVQGVLMVIDSPGGSASGTAELGDEVERTRASKPVHVYVDDLAASAAYWVASQADHISSGRMGSVGSIGVVAALVDSSKAMEERGIEVLVFSTGPHKGAGTPGAPITEEQRAEFQARVERTNEHFIEAVSKGRGVTEETVSVWADGRVFDARRALKMGMIDSIGTLEEAMDKLLAETESREAADSRRAEIRRQRLALAQSALDCDRARR